MHKHGGDVYTYKDLTDYSANINPQGIPQSIIDAVSESAKFAAQYPDVQCRELRTALSLAENIPIEQIQCGNGAAELIFSLVLAKKPKKAILIAPTFYEYEQALRAIDCEINYYYLKEENNFQLQEDYFSLLDPSVDMIFFCNPNNPTGHAVERKILEQILEICEKNQILFVLDECFNDFLDQPETYTMKSYIDKSKSLFILKAFTKMYAMAGLRLGYCFHSDLDMLLKMKEVTQPWSVSTTAQWAGIAALKETDYVKRTRSIVTTERSYLCDALASLGFTLYTSMANYIFFKAPEILGENIKNHGFMIRDCSNYHGLTKGFYRIAVKSHEENIRLIEAMKISLEEA